MARGIALLREGVLALQLGQAAPYERVPPSSGALDANAVVRADRAGSVRIDQREASVQGGEPLLLQLAGGNWSRNPVEAPGASSSPRKERPDPQARPAGNDHALCPRRSTSAMAASASCTKRAASSCSSGSATSSR